MYTKTIRLFFRLAYIVDLELGNWSRAAFMHKEPPIKSDVLEQKGASISPVIDGHMVCLNFKANIWQISLNKWPKI